MKAFLVLSFLFMSSLAQAITQGQWTELVQKIIADGNKMELRIGEVRSFSHVVPEDITVSRVANYVSVLGTTNEFGFFTPRQSALTSETWTHQEGMLFIVEQWHFYLNPETGEPINVVRTVMKHNDGLVTFLPDEPVDEAKAIEVFNAAIQHWIPAIIPSR
ncbi:MAG: hypothetical protein K2Q26_02690 [Bdellovibrionales bacterium]|nr:hypothetical protein [Bdellovibrionales bacterium]